MIFGVVPANAMGTIVVEPGTGAIIYSQNPVPAGSSFRVEFTVSDDAATACCTSPSVRMSNGNGTIVGTYPASMISTTSNYGVVGRTGYVYSATVSTPSTLIAGQYFIEANVSDSKGAQSGLLLGNVVVATATIDSVPPTVIVGSGHISSPSITGQVVSVPVVGNVTDGISTGAQVTLTFSVSDNIGVASVNVVTDSSNVDNKIGNTIPGMAGPAVLVSGNQQSGTYSFKGTFPAGAVCGQYTARAYAFDAAGNKSDLTTIYRINVVTCSAAPPTPNPIPQSSMDIASFVTNGNSVSVNYSVTVGSSVFVQTRGGSGNLATSLSAGPASVCTLTNVNSYATSINGYALQVPEGTGILNGISPGSCTVTGTRNSSAEYLPISVTQIYTVSPSQQVVLQQQSISPILPSTLITGQSAQISSRGMSGSGSISYSSLTPGTCSVLGLTVSALTVGNCTIQALISADQSYSTASGSGTFQVTSPPATGVASLGSLPAPVSIGINYPNQIVLNAPYNPGSNNLSGMTLSVRTFTQAGALVSNLPYTGNQVYITGLQPSTNYVVEMVATDSTGATKFSSPLNVTTSPAALQPALTPGINAQSISLVPNGFTVQIANYDANFSWSISSTQGSASISNSGLVNVTGATGGTVQVTVTTNRNGYSSGSYTFSSSVGSQQKAPTPVFGSVNSVQGGFATSVSNYDANFTWTATSSLGNVSGFPVMAVMGLNPGQTSTITVTVSRNGYTSSSASIQGSALTLQGPLVPQFGSPKGTSDGFSISVSNYDSSFDWALNADSCYASITYSGLIQASGMRPGGTCKISVTSKKSGYQNGQADVTGTTAVLQPPSISMLPGSTGAAVSDRLEVSVAFGKQADASISSFGIKLQGSSSYSVSSQSYGYSNSYGSFNGSTADYYWSGGHLENGSISIDVSRLSPGTYTLIGYATASESGFNDVSGQGSLTFNVVQAKPQVSITSPSSGSSLKGKIHVTALTSFNVSTSHKIKNVGISISDAIPNFFGSSPYSSLLPATYKVTNYSGTGSIDWVIDTGKLPVGSNSVTVQVEDDQGNIASSTASFNVSRAVPTVSVTSPNEGQSITGGLKLSFRAAGDPSSGSGIAFIGLDDPNFVPQFASNQLRSSNQNGFAGYTVWQVADLGKYDFAEESKYLSDGPKTIHIIVADADGYSASASVNVNVLSTNPTISLSSSSGGSIAPESTFRLSARVAPAQGSGATLSYVGIDDSSASIGFNGTQSSNSDFGLPSTVQLWSVANPSSVSWTLNPAKWNSGPKTINVYAIDSNGHSSVATISFIVLPKATWTLTQKEPAVLGQSVLVGISTSTDIPWDPNSAITVVVQTAPSSNGPWSDVGPLLLDSSGNVGARVVMSDAVTWVRVNHPTPDAVRTGFSAPLQLLSVQSSSEVGALAQTGTRLANGDGTFPAVTCVLVKKSQNIACSIKNVQNVNQPVAMQVQKNGVWVSYRTLKISDLSLIKFSKTGKTLHSYRLVGAPVDSSRKPYIPWVTQVIKSLGL